MIYTINAIGIKLAQTKFNRLGAGRLDARPAMREVGYTMMDIINRIFESQGRRGGGSWRQLTDEWLTRKVNEGLDPRIGYATGALVRSLTNDEDPNNILEVHPQSVSLGSALEYAVPQDENRPYTKFTNRDRKLMVEMVRGYLMTVYKHGLKPTQ